MRINGKHPSIIPKNTWVLGFLVRNLDFYKNIKKQLNFLNVKDSQIVKLKNIV